MVFFSLFWTPLSTNFLGVLCLCMLNMLWSLVVCFTYFASWVLCHALFMHLVHASHMHTTSTLDVHTLLLYMFCIHSCYVSLFRLLALITCYCDYVFLSISILGKFVCFLWTNLYLIKFVTMFMFVLFAYCYFVDVSLEENSNDKNSKASLLLPEIV